MTEKRYEEVSSKDTALVIFDIHDCMMHTAGTIKQMSCANNLRLRQ